MRPIGEAATKIMDQHAEFAGQYRQVPWRSMRGMRNRIAHGYFDINPQSEAILYQTDDASTRVEVRLQDGTA